MAKTRIFLSSTCFDLKALREQVREKIQFFGHDLLASEYSSFPVAPDVTTVENCKKVVRDHADLMVLIVGGRRGSLDPSSARSVVNSEYIEARSKGIACFIFVDRQVWDLLPIYHKNRAADFSPTVDHPQVFEFIEDLKKEARWIFPFSRTEEITSVLETQLSVYFRMLIERSRKGVLMIPRSFSLDPEPVISLLQERPPFWEYLLTCTLLENAITAGQRRLSELNKGAIYRRVTRLSEDAAMDYLQGEFSNLANLGYAFEAVMPAINEAWGPPGVAGDPIEIRRVCQNMSDLIDGLVNWEIDIRFISVPDQYHPLFETLRGSTKDFLDEIARGPAEIRKGIELARNSSTPVSMTIDLKVRAPSSLEKFNVALEELRRRLGLS